MIRRRTAAILLVPPKLVGYVWLNVIEDEQTTIYTTELIEHVIEYCVKGNNCYQSHRMMTVEYSDLHFLAGPDACEHL